MQQPSQERIQDFYGGGGGGGVKKIMAGVHRPHKGPVTHTRRTARALKNQLKMEK